SWESHSAKVSLKESKTLVCSPRRLGEPHDLSAIIYSEGTSDPRAGKINLCSELSSTISKTLDVASRADERADDVSAIVNSPCITIGRAGGINRGESAGAQRKSMGGKTLV